MNTIFLKTYKNDFPWLRYALISIAKFAKGFDRVCVAMGTEDLLEYKGNPDHQYAEVRDYFKQMGLPLELYVTPPPYDGYIGQQLAKIGAPQLIRQPDGIIFYFDSDCIFTEEANITDYIDDGKLQLLFTPYEAMRDPITGEYAVPWKGVTEQFMRMPVENEYMRRHPLLYWAEDLIEFKTDILKVWKQTGLPHVDTLKGIVDQMSTFSEFNAIGSYVHRWAPEGYHFINTQTESLPNPKVKQYWSHGGLTQEIRQDIERRLA